MAFGPLDMPLAVYEVLTRRFQPRLDTDKGRFQARVLAELVDHGALRHLWTNAGVIADGVYRGNHPGARQLARWKALGIGDVLSLRVASGVVHRLEAERCAALGLRLHNVSLGSRGPSPAGEFLKLLEFYDTLPRPFLVHCKSGADRTGLAGALWAIHKEGAKVSEARRHLSLRHLHFKWSKTGVLDRFLDQYEAEGEAAGIALKDWIAETYDPERLRRA